MWIKLMDLLAYSERYYMKTLTNQQNPLPKFMPSQASFGSKLTALGSKLTAFGSKLMALGSKLAKFMALGLKLIALGSKLEMGATGAIGASAYLGQVCKICKNCNKWFCKTLGYFGIFVKCELKNHLQTNGPKKYWTSWFNQRCPAVCSKGNSPLAACRQSSCNSSCTRFNYPNKGRKHNHPAGNVTETRLKHVDTLQLQLFKAKVNHIRTGSSLFKKQPWCFKRLSTDKQATKPNLLSWTYCYQYHDASLQTFLSANQLPSDAPEVKCSKRLFYTFIIENFLDHFSINRDHLRCLWRLHAKFLFTNGFAAAILEQDD